MSPSAADPWQVVLRNDRLVSYALRLLPASAYPRAAALGHDRADLLQIGRLGFHEAMGTYDPTKGALSTHAVIRMRRRLQDAAGLRRQQPDFISLEEVLGPHDGRRLLDTLAAPESPERLDTEDQIALLRRHLEALPPRWRAILLARYGLSAGGPQKLATLGARYGVSVARIHKLEKKALSRLRALMGEAGPGKEA